MFAGFHNLSPLVTMFCSICNLKLLIANWGFTYQSCFISEPLRGHNIHYSLAETNEINEHVVIYTNVGSFQTFNCAPFYKLSPL